MEQAGETTLAKTSNEGLKGIAWMLLSVLLFSAMHTMIKDVAKDIHPFEIAFFRNLFGFVVLAPIFMKQGLAPLRTKRLGLLTWRAIFNSTAMAMYFLSISLIPLADATALSFTAPIFVTLLAIPILGERIGLNRGFAIVCAFGGAMVILRPGFQEIEIGTVLVLVSALFWASAILVIKILSRTESSVTVTAYMGLLMTPISLIPALFVWSWPSWETLGMLAIMGLLGTIAQYAMTEALRFGETHVIMPMDYTRLLWMAIAGWLVFQEVPTVYTWIGGLMIAGSASYIAWRESRKGRPINQPAKT
ncbi:DMT family transporter [Aestuariispira ectoiniformans]|uniref:DMT family transporter n=1 Tax=Aestuariispira ectoiniformans TaxID=2775080 RepID=UPI00223C304D|nr:DMT family transporter [Aestuariispira ectoiniformans]